MTKTLDFVKQYAPGDRPIYADDLNAILEAAKERKDLSAVAPISRTPGGSFGCSFYPREGQLAYISVAETTGTPNQWAYTCLRVTPDIEGHTAYRTYGDALTNCYNLVEATNPTSGHGNMGCGVRISEEAYSSGQRIDSALGAYVALYEILPTEAGQRPGFWFEHVNNADHTPQYTIVAYSGGTAPAGYAACTGGTAYGLSIPDGHHRFLVSSGGGGFGTAGTMASTHGHDVHGSLGDPTTDHGHEVTGYTDASSGATVSVADGISIAPTAHTHPIGANVGLETAGIHGHTLTDATHAAVEYMLTYIYCFLMMKL